MQNENQDWLDERLAVQNYIQDDGFTARVVSRLPKMRAQAEGLLRWRILFVSALLSACLVAVQIVPLARSLTQLFFRPTAMEATEQLSRFVQQPEVLYGGAAGIILLGFAAIPFIRRWG